MVKTRKVTRELQVRDGFLMVVLVDRCCLLATVPLMLQLDMSSFTDAYFEPCPG